jgi:uncharacterized protein YjbI with pentapeptide repeats
MANPAHVNRIRELAATAEETARKTLGASGRRDAGTDLMSVILQGKVAWAEWRKGTVGPLDLSGADLSGLLLAGMDFAHANMVGANLAKCRIQMGQFDNANLSNASFAGAFMWCVSFDKASMVGTDWSGAEVSGTPGFRGTDLRDANFSEAVVWAPRTDAGTNLTGATFQGCRIKVVELDRESGPALAKAFMGRMSDIQKGQLVSQPDEVPQAQAKPQPAGGCFIATAACGDSNAWEVAALRAYRDRTLLCTSWGRWFVRVYYTLSPPTARFISRHRCIRTLVRATIIRPLGLFAQSRNGGPRK